jgi:hypothetical protein
MSGDWPAIGVLKEPVDCRWSSSKISCSSLGNRGGFGAFANGVVLRSALWNAVDENEGRGAVQRRRRGGNTVRVSVGWDDIAVGRGRKGKACD